MDTSKLKKFAAFARRSLMEQVSKRLKLVLVENSAARRERPQIVKALERAISQSGEEQVIERVAYIWFNRFCALRFMDVNRYTRIGVVSPADGQFQPEILAEAKMGHIDDDLADAPTHEKILGLLDGKVPSSDPQTEAYRLLLVAACNDWHKAMPYLFEKINDYTELLMPDDLLSGSSILAYTREALTPDACQDVEVIGWLYQFYISEKKDEVFEGLKKNKKITPENIPAATQLFTPHWIVRYLVENSLGRLWMLNRPQSKLIDQMEYYIKSEELETDFLKISSPEEIKVCDPACGSGHMLTYAFDLLYAIYEESGYESNEIPEKILTHNLYGIEIDERAGELAAFALTMKARAKQRRFFRNPVQPNICVLENISVSEETLKNYARVFGKELFSNSVIETLQQFSEAKNFGSLIIPKIAHSRELLEALNKLKERSLLSIGNAEQLSQEQQLLVSTPNFDAINTALKQAEILDSKYHVVIANPPYFGPKMMGDKLKFFAASMYPDSKTDLYAMFMERGFKLLFHRGYMAMVTMQSWMFLHSFEDFRVNLLSTKTILSMAHLGPRAFETISGEIVTVTAFSILNTSIPSYRSTFHRLIDGNHKEKNNRLKANINCFSGIQQSNFLNIPGSPVAYWMGETVLASFSRKKLSDFTISDGQNITADNDKYVRYHWEVSFHDIGKDCKWLFYAKGGPFRRWFGNLDFVVDWSSEARDNYRKNSSARIIPEYLWYKEGVTWSRVGTTLAGFRLLPQDSTFDKVGSSIFPEKVEQIYFFLGLLNSPFAQTVLEMLNPSIDIQVKDVRNIPLPDLSTSDSIDKRVKSLIELTKIDWAYFETSDNFITNPFFLRRFLNDSNSTIGDLHVISGFPIPETVSSTYSSIRETWQSITLEVQGLEEENNEIFINAYGLNNELKSKVDIKTVSLTCNPYYRYGGNKTEEVLETLLLADTTKEFISYAVGCMFGRFALEKPGLILANQGETLDDYFKQIPNPSFPADEDNVIPILDGDWFTDDITERFRKFLRLTFGEEHYVENLSFIEDAIGKDLRKYFLKDFYTDHVKRYKKRPIYWLFSSPKGSFNALIYMHRYQPDTVSLVLNYLRDYSEKLTVRMKHLKKIEVSEDASKAEKAKALKEIVSLRKTLDELDTWEREIMYPLATEKITIDLDKGVKHNYNLFGAALKKIPGLEAKDED